MVEHSLQQVILGSSHHPSSVGEIFWIPPLEALIALPKSISAGRLFLGPAARGEPRGTPLVSMLL
jgi:hypothetical protein